MANANVKPATAYTKNWNKEQKRKADPVYIEEEKRYYQIAKQHLLLSLLEKQEGEDLWTAPDDVNPYLWQHQQTNHIAGIFSLSGKEVVMAGGVDIATILFVKSKTGWVIVDAGASVEAARYCMELAEKATGEQIAGKIRGVVYSHSHFDHFAGVGAFIPDENNPENIPVIAPAQFEESKIEDHLYAGVAMARRLQYQAGILNQEDTLKKRLSTPILQGAYSYVEPNTWIDTSKTLKVDGLTIDFIDTPNTETIAHMAVYLNDYDVLYLGDNSMGMLHNTYTMRGAVVRDADFWSKKYYEMYLKYGARAKAVAQGHGIAHWNTKEDPDVVKKVLMDNAAAYKYINDQSLFYANQGYTMNEINTAFKVPECIQRVSYIRPHYGSYCFNAKGVYQKYLGFYDGNPVHLETASEVETAKKFVEYVGSAEKVLKKAQEDFDRGEYQSCAVASNYVVFADPDNMQARYLCADALEQLAYMAESFLWRNAYLTGAAELRNPGRSEKARDVMNNSVEDITSQMPAELILAKLGIAIDCNRAVEEDLTFLLKIAENLGEDADEIFLLKLYKGTLHYMRLEAQTEQHGDGLPVVTTTTKGLYALFSKEEKLDGSLYQTRHLSILERLRTYLVDFSEYREFHLIEP